MDNINLFHLGTREREGLMSGLKPKPLDLKNSLVEFRIQIFQIRPTVNLNYLLMKIVNHLEVGRVYK